MLEPGGYFSCYEWMRSDADYSDDMRYWFKVEGLTYAMETLATYGDLLETAGFVVCESGEMRQGYCRGRRPA